MKVFCPEHQRGFLAPRQTPIKCENKGHILGELDFEGQGKPAIELQWQYCCNCEHFCPINFKQDGLQRCAVCNRRTSLLYLCAQCYTISFESNTPLQTKNFTLTSDGAPQPSCPGCLLPSSADLREHGCDGLGTSFVTALDSCPMCQERLDIGPSFPSSVALYLKRTRAANKLTVTFDYETELFVPVEDGEFVLITNGNEASQSIVLPRPARFENRREFYEFYQDYYHCAKPAVGEVHIIQPAVVAPTAAGWRLQGSGILEVLEEPPKRRASVESSRYQIDAVAHEEQPFIAASDMESAVRPCTHCGTLVERRYGFCWKCGNPITSKDQSPATNCEKPRTPLAPMAADFDEVTVQHGLHPVASPMFSWAAASEPKSNRSSKGTLLKLITVGVVGVLLIFLGLFVVTRSVSTVRSITAVQPVTPVIQSAPTAPTLAPKGVTASEPMQQRTSGLQLTFGPAAEEEELKKLRQTRIAATASTRPALFQIFARVEKQYPNDYRFPYERAKLAIKESQSISHDEAFDALAVAAEKAINNGKAGEMLDGLESDKAGDFHKLSHGHQEWNQLAEALRNRNTALLARR